MTDFLVPMSPGELLDKITILQIKSERIDDAGKLANVRRELGILDGRGWQLDRLRRGLRQLRRVAR